MGQVEATSSMVYLPLMRKQMHRRFISPLAIIILLVEHCALVSGQFPPLKFVLIIERTSVSRDFLWNK